MLKKLKFKFILAALIALSVVITLIVGAINLFNYRSIISDADDTLRLIMDNSGRFPSKPSHVNPDMDIIITPESPFESRYFTVRLKGDKVVGINTESIAAIDDETAIKMSREVIKDGDEKGFYGIYRYLIKVNEDKFTVLFLDCTKVLDNANTFLWLSITISLLGISEAFVLLWVMSERIVKPISDGYEKQNQFITNAGHDIKTPITIIDADAELLEMEVGKNEWLDDIKKQTARLATLTEELIYLSKLDEHSSEPHTEFPISDVVEEVAASFSAPARKRLLTIKTNIQPALFYEGDGEAIRKLITLLMDNAVKYSPEGKAIDLSLKKTGRGVVFRISNLAPELSDESVKHMFDRFYRSDKARSSAGGFGIGLSVADAIVSSHKGNISAEKQDDILTVEVNLY